MRGWTISAGVASSALALAAVDACSTNAPETGDGGSDAFSDVSVEAACEGAPQSDPDNCGACGHGCLGGTCVAGQCQPFALATAQTPTAVALDAVNVYWADGATSYLATGSIWKMSLSGGNPVKLAANQRNPWAIAVDDTNVYWVGNVEPGGSVSSVPIAGGTAASVVPGLDADCVSLTLTDAEVVWSQVNSIARAPKTGGNATNILGALAVSMTTDGAFLYWTNAQSPTGNVEMTALFGDAGTVPLVDKLDGPLGITLRDGALYWVNRGTVADAGSVMTAPTDGGVATTLASGAFHPYALALDTTDVYFVDLGTQKADDGAILRAPRSGGPVTIVATKQGAPISIAVNSTAIYWANQYDGTIMRLAK